MNLIGPMEIESIGGKRYSMVVVDDYSRYTWIEFLKDKSKSFSFFKILYKKFKTAFNLKVSRIRLDHGRES